MLMKNTVRVQGSLRMAGKPGKRKYRKQTVFLEAVINGAFNALMHAMTIGVISLSFQGWS
jgi:hypothetical protein